MLSNLVLEKTLESPLDSKEIRPVNPKGNQPWIFIGRTDVEAPILWPPDAKRQLIGKDPDAEKDWGQRRGRQRMRWHHWLNGHESEQTPGDSEGQRSLMCCYPWDGRLRQDSATKQQPGEPGSYKLNQSLGKSGNLYFNITQVILTGWTNDLHLRTIILDDF